MKIQIFSGKGFIGSTFIKKCREKKIFVLSMKEMIIP